jgi:hypothetical protein
MFGFGFLCINLRFSWKKECKERQIGKIKMHYCPASPLTVPDDSMVLVVEWFVIS